MPTCRACQHFSRPRYIVTLFGDFVIPEKVTNILTWPKPTSIPSSKIDKEKWNNNLFTSNPPDDVNSCSIQFFADWAQHWERALGGCVQDQPAGICQKLLEVGHGVHSPSRLLWHHLSPSLLAKEKYNCDRIWCPHRFSYGSSSCVGFKVSSTRPLLTSKLWMLKSMDGHQKRPRL